MKKIVRLTESDLVRLVNRVLNEQGTSGQKWGTGKLIRLPMGSNNTNDYIRIEITPKRGKDEVMVAVKTTTKVRSEIKNNLDVFNQVEKLLGNKFFGSSTDPNWDVSSGLVDSQVTKNIVDMLKKLKVDSKNNMFTESVSTRSINKVIKEQNTQQDYKDIADALHNSMEGISSSKDAENIKSIILNRINNKNDWEGVKRAFGVKDGENLEQWLSGEMRIDLKQILGWIGEKETQYRKEDSMYNPGSKIRLITNRQFIMARAYQYASTMGDKEELEVDMSDSIVVKRDKDAIVVKSKYVRYYSVGERRRGENPKQESLNDVCVRIPFSEIIQWSGDSLQVRWLSDFVKSRIVPCQ